MAPLNPPRPPTTSGRRVLSTAPRISSTARSPASTSTPAAAYVPRDVSGTGRDRLFEEELPGRRVVWHGFRVAAVEARETEPVVRQLQRVEDAADRQVAERVRTDEVPDLIDGMRRCDQLGLDLGVDSIEARVVDRRGGGSPRGPPCARA